MRLRATTFVLLACTVLTTWRVQAELPPLIPRTVLFGDPDRLNPQISPDGKRLAYVAPDEGVLNVWIRTLGQKDDRPLTHDRKLGIRNHFWAANSQQIVYVQDREGNDSRHVFCVDLESGQERDLTPFEGVRARVVGTSPSKLNEILIAVNNRNPKLLDVYRADLTTGELTLAVRNNLGFVGWLADGDLNVRGALTIRSDGGHTLHVRDTAESRWRKLATWGPKDALTSGPISFTGDGRGIYVLSSVRSNTGQLRKIDIATGWQKTLAFDDTADISQIAVHPTRRTIQAVAYVKDCCQWQVLDQTVAADFEAIRKVQPGDFGIINRDRDDRIWLICFSTDDGPDRYYVYDRATRKAKFLFTNRRALESVTLAKMKPIGFKARDGLGITGYLTTPPGVPDRNLPMVVHVHGGPWERHRWGYDAVAQWLASRGYAVLQVNYRGSRGFGKEFVNAGNREWGRKMQDDLLDGVQWAVDSSVADPTRVGIYGTGYGGYAVLAGLAFTPEAFRCGVAYGAPVDLVAYMRDIPPHWRLIEPILWDRVGHPEKDAEMLRSRSPLSHTDRIISPLLLARGGDDPEVRKSDTLKLVDALEKAGRTVEYIEYPGEREGLVHSEDRLDFCARVERFFATHLGGRVEE